jgi:mannitol-specific phosphotransferase system IIBC component
MILQLLSYVQHPVLLSNSAVVQAEHMLAEANERAERAEQQRNKAMQLLTDAQQKSQVTEVRRCIIFCSTMICKMCGALKGTLVSNLKRRLRLGCQLRSKRRLTF